MKLLYIRAPPIIYKQYKRDVILLENWKSPNISNKESANIFVTVEIGNSKATYKQWRVKGMGKVKGLNQSMLGMLIPNYIHPKNKIVLK